MTGRHRPGNRRPTSLGRHVAAGSAIVKTGEEWARCRNRKACAEPPGRAVGHSPANPDTVGRKVWATTQTHASAVRATPRCASGEVSRSLVWLARVAQISELVNDLPRAQGPEHQRGVGLGSDPHRLGRADPHTLRQDRATGTRADVLDGSSCGRRAALDARVRSDQGTTIGAREMAISNETSSPISCRWRRVA